MSARARAYVSVFNRDGRGRRNDDDWRTVAVDDLVLSVLLLVVVLALLLVNELKRGSPSYLVMMAGYILFFTAQGFV